MHSLRSTRRSLNSCEKRPLFRYFSFIFYFFLTFRSRGVIIKATHTGKSDFLKKEISMKFCTNCGNQIADDAAFCPSCGSSATNNAAPTTTYATPVAADEVNIGLCVVSALIPLFGIIFWALKYKETPKKAKACGITAIVAWVISFVLGLILSVVSSLLLSGLYI